MGYIGPCVGEAEPFLNWRVKLNLVCLGRVLGVYSTVWKVLRILSKEGLTMVSDFWGWRLVNKSREINKFSIVRSNFWAGKSILGLVCDHQEVPKITGKIILFITEILNGISLPANCTAWGLSICLTSTMSLFVTSTLELQLGRELWNIADN